MKDIDEDRLLGQHLSGDPPREVFREQALAASTAALLRVQRRRSAWRRAELAAAAVLIAGIAFFGGRLSAPPPPSESVDATPWATAEPEGVAVPTELIEWLEAARLFRQLGMQDRMARAVYRAGRLLPEPTTAAIDPTQQVFNTVDDRMVENPSMHAGFSGRPSLFQSVQQTHGIMARSLGGYDHESRMD